MAQQEKHMTMNDYVRQTIRDIAIEETINDLDPNAVAPSFEELTQRAANRTRELESEVKDSLRI